MSTDGHVAAALRWTAAVAVGAVAHAGLLWWVSTHVSIQADPPDAPQGITIDLEPVAVSQNAAAPSATMASGTSPAPQSAAAPSAGALAATPDPPPPEAAPTQPAPSPPASPEPPPPPEVALPAPAPPPAAAPEPQPAPEPAPPHPERPLAVTPQQPPPPPESPLETSPEQDAKSDAVLAPPPPPPLPKPLPKPEPKVTPPPPDPRQLARAAQARNQARALRTAQPREAGGASTQSQAASSVSSGQSVATWRGEVMARLEAYKPGAPNGATGTARVAFSVDRGGRVISASIAEGSGDSSLDAAAVSMVRRASPLPAPPAEMGGRISLSVPVRIR